ncbi:MAG TPA: COX15/CtaA family protein [Methylomirabilota bacterium]|nr:COX15/CtaA family protein [Methylomirabilota bacterium]
MVASPPRALAWTAVAAVFALMTIGNIVSATGSGLACPDWPLCHGSLIPPLRPDVLVEYGHRLAAVAASLLLVTTIAITLHRTGPRGAGRLGIALLALLGVQIGLGGVTVLLKLPHLISTTHLVNALLIFGGLLLIAVGTEPAAAFPGSFKLARLARAGLVVLLVQLALGGYVRHTGAGLACPDWPLCSGDVLPGHWLAAVHWVHRWLGVTLLGFFAQLALASRRTPLARPAALACALGVLQVVLGIGAVLLQLDFPIRAAHAAVGYALWGVLIWLSARAGAWRALLADGRGQAPQRRLESAHAA